MDKIEETILDERYRFEKDLGEHETEVESIFHSRGYLYLYLTKENLTQGYLFSIKNYLIRIVNSIRKYLIIGIIFSEDVIQEYDFENNLSAIQNILNSVYNIFEPEYSKQFPMVTIAITLPQVFQTPVIPQTTNFDVFFYDSDIVAKSQFLACLSQNKISDESLWKDIKDTRDINLITAALSEEESKKSLLPSEETKEKAEKFKYKMTCLGGTFDHLHLGHKLLLTNACFYTKETIIIGITSSSLLSKKKWAHFLEDFETRKYRVNAFINLLTEGKIKAEIYELNDPCGPAGEIKDIEALILTPEVAKGGDYCNGIREQNNLPTWELVFVDMILNEKEDSGENKFSNKTSSSYIRQYLDDKTGHMAEELYQRFYQLCDDIGLPSDQKLKWWTILRDSYCTHWRYYFNLYHIYNILKCFDENYKEEEYGAENKIIIEIAIWFHRIVFLPLNIDLPYNAHQSYLITQKFIEETSYQKITTDDFKLIKSLIMSVHRHRQTEEYADATHDKINKFFLDIILVFLGFDSEEYQKYKEKVRLDYLWVEKSEYRQKRKVILQRLLDRDRIYITDHMHEKYEHTARENLQVEVEADSPEL